MGVGFGRFTSSLIISCASPAKSAVATVARGGTTMSHPAAISRRCNLNISRSRRRIRFRFTALPSAFLMLHPNRLTSSPLGRTNSVNSRLLRRRPSRYTASYSARRTSRVSRGRSNRGGSDAREGVAPFLAACGKDFTSTLCLQEFAESVLLVAAPHMRLIRAFRQRKSPLIFSARPPTGPHGLAGLNPASNLSPAQALSHNTTQQPPARNKQFRRPHAQRSRNPAAAERRKNQKNCPPEARDLASSAVAVGVDPRIFGWPILRVFREVCGFRPSCFPTLAVLRPKPPWAVTGNRERNPLLVPQRHHRIHPHRPSRRHKTRHYHHDHQPAGPHYKRHRIGTLHPKQLAPHHPRQQKRPNNPNPRSNDRQHQSVTHHQQQHVPAAGSQRHPNPQFVGPPRNRIARHAVNPHHRQQNRQSRKRAQQKH